MFTFSDFIVFLPGYVPEYEKELCGPWQERIFVCLGGTAVVSVFTSPGTCYPQDYPAGVLLGSGLFILCSPATCLSAISLLFLSGNKGREGEKQGKAGFFFFF